MDLVVKLLRESRFLTLLYVMGLANVLSIQLDPAHLSSNKSQMALSILRLSAGWLQSRPPPQFVCIEGLPGFGKILVINTHNTNRVD
jgi:hypothetical protein